MRWRDAIRATSRRRAWQRLALLALLAVVFWPVRARAAGMDDDAFRGILLLLCVVSAGYVLTHLAVERLSRRYIVAADVQYVLLGIVLGPALGIIDPELARSLRPVLLLGAGALGLLSGVELRAALSDSTRAWAPALTITLGTALAVIGLPMLGLSLAGYDLVGPQAWTGALIAAGIIALSTTDASVAAMAVLLRARGSAHVQAMRVAEVIRAMAATGFGVMFAVLPNASELQMRSPLLALETTAVQVAAGAVLGLLFAASVYRKLDDRVLLTVLVGTIFFAAGIAQTTHVSAIFVCFVAGLVFSVSSRRVGEVTTMLSGIRRPFVIVLFFFAGLEWVTGPPWTFALVIPYLALRWAGRRAGGWLGGTLAPGRDDFGAATLPAGGLAVAFMLSLRLSYPDVPGIRDVYGALLVAIILTEFGALRAIRRWLIDVDDVPPERHERSRSREAKARG